ncbi:MAG: hypothetical protein Q4C36_10570 [Coriobacteriia bacterium]|nr:hypothetical protein [Coriobacteriia bacterium]
MAGLQADGKHYFENHSRSSWDFNPEAAIRDYCREHPMQHFKVFSAWNFPGWGKQHLQPKTEKKIRGHFAIPDSEQVFLAFDADLSFFGPSKFGFALCSTGIYAANLSFEGMKKVPELEYQRWQDLDFDAYIFELEEVDEVVEEPQEKDFYRLDPDGEWIHLFGHDYLVDSDFVRKWLLGLNESLMQESAGEF